ncbi:hypothetical protein MFIFM68171_02414 [Madurella fahalii]|uniref:Uncharacterized protein n=1 Tax=Madurella fahalii TaxID=1157608 RepID=A0ABQ0G3C7_9PEZI
MVTLAQLEQAAADVVNIMKSITEYSEASIAVIGGLAVWKYIQDGRTTQDVDFIISIDSAPQSVKSKLLALPNSPFIQQAQYFLYKSSDGDQIQIDITPAWQSPYLPAAAKKLKNIPAGSVPYISPTDLLIFKMHSCGLRAQALKSVVDATDAAALLAGEPSAGPSQHPKKSSKGKSNGKRH